MGGARALILLLAAALAPSFQGTAPESGAVAAELAHLERKGGVMGTSMQLEALGTDEAALEAALLAAEAELRRVEDLMTDWRDSPLMRLNARAGEGPVPVEHELAVLVHRALLVARLTDGAFDPTWRALVGLWDFKADPPRVPTDEEVATALAFVDHRRVKVDLVNDTVELPAGFQLGLGGIAKGYGVDRAMKVLRERGVEHGLVDAGGDLKALGLRHGETWKVAIRHPRERDRVLALIPVSNRCVVTSGDYERFFELDGRRYHHVLDPRTGRPSTGCTSATVVGPDAATCDALATALCVLGPADGLAVLAGSGEYEGLVVGQDGSVHASPGLRESLTDEGEGAGSR